MSLVRYLPNVTPRFLTTGSQVSCPDETECKPIKVAITLTRAKQSKFPVLSV